MPLPASIGKRKEARVQHVWIGGQCWVMMRGAWSMCSPFWFKLEKSPSMFYWSKVKTYITCNSIQSSQAVTEVWTKSFGQTSQSGQKKQKQFLVLPLNKYARFFLHCFGVFPLRPFSASEEMSSMLPDFLYREICREVSGPSVGQRDLLIFCSVKPPSWRATSNGSWSPGFCHSVTISRSQDASNSSGSHLVLRQSHLSFRSTMCYMIWCRDTWPFNTISVPRLPRKNGAFRCDSFSSSAMGLLQFAFQ